MASSANNVVISPVNVLWQISANEQIDFAGLTGLNVKGGSFDLFLADGSEFYVWGDDSVEVDPAPGGTGIPFTVTGDSDTAATLATACAAAIDANANFSATASGTVVDVKRAAFGEVTDAADNDMGVAITTCRKGKDFDLGLLQGDVELNFAPANFIVQAHQTGVTPRAALNQGVETNEATTTLLETQKSQLKEIYKIYGGTYNPGTEIFGVGTAKNGQNLLIDAARLKLRPVNAVDASEDTVIMLAVPVPDTLVFSGENPRTLSVTWQGYVDDTYASTNVNVLAVGDVEQ